MTVLTFGLTVSHSHMDLVGAGVGMLLFSERKAKIQSHKNNRILTLEA
jgi:hypothetical protein